MRLHAKLKKKVHKNPELHQSVIKYLGVNTSVVNAILHHALKPSLSKVLYSVRFLSGNNGFYGFDLLAGVVRGHGGSAPPHPLRPPSAPAVQTGSDGR